MTFTQPDLLRKRAANSGYDRWLFIILFLIGTVGILSARFANLHSAITVPIGVGALVVYALLVWRSPLYRLREDRGGDGAYYLGFLFTLVSLSYALWEFGARARDVELIIRNFAIALATTIAGLVVRVMFHQMREDLDEVEEQARLSLSEMVQRLKSEMIYAIEGMCIFRTRIRQEIQDEFGKSVTAIADETVASLRRLVSDQAKYLEETRKQLHEQLRWSQEQTSETRKVHQRLVRSIDGLVSRIDKAEVPSEGLRQKFAEFVAVVEEQIRGEKNRWITERQMAAAANEALSQMADAAQQLDGNLKLLQSAIAVLQQTTKQAEAATGHFGKQLEAMSGAAEKFVASQLAQLEQLVDTAQQHLANVQTIAQRLGEAVERSTGAVTTVHHELVSAVTALERGLNAQQRR